jgi:hypothetical protein
MKAVVLACLPILEERRPLLDQPPLVAPRGTDCSSPAVWRSSCPMRRRGFAVPRRATSSRVHSSTIGRWAVEGSRRVAIVETDTPTAFWHPAARSSHRTGSMHKAYPAAAQRDQRLRPPATTTQRSATRLQSPSWVSCLHLGEICAHQHHVVVRPQRQVPVQVGAGALGGRRPRMHHRCVNSAVLLGHQHLCG